MRSCRTALILVAMAFALTACGRFTVMPPPDGELVVLKAGRTCDHVD